MPLWSSDSTARRRVAPAIALLVGAEAALFFTFLVVFGPLTLSARLVPLVVVLVLSAALYGGHDWSRWALLAPIVFRLWRIVPITAAAWGVGRVGTALFLTVVILAELGGGFILIDTYLGRRAPAPT